MKKNVIETAHLTLNEQGTPVSQHFDDVYFSNEGEQAETRYVFLSGNDFPARFSRITTQTCTVAETGFGTGLNFLTLCRSFRNFRNTHPDSPLQRLHFISFEKYPLTPDDLQTAHDRWPEFADFSLQLYAQWPHAAPGCHRIFLDNGEITLDLWLGDISTLLPSLTHALDNKIDAWFLDGFAPSKNPDMWQQTLFELIARFTRQGGTFATFTAAGFVRRGLQQAGFDVERRTGFAHKRECLAGINTRAPATSLTPWHDRHPAAARRRIAVIGGGIAGVLSALALLQRGAEVSLYCADDSLATNASGNRQGALYPLLTGLDDPLERFFTVAFTFARRAYDSLSAQGVKYSHDWCGVIQLMYNEKNRKKINAIAAVPRPETLFKTLSRQQLSELAGQDVNSGGLYYPAGGWLCPQELVRGAAALAQKKGLHLYLNHNAERLEPTAQGWQIRFADNTTAQSDVVVLANGHHITQYPQTAALPVTPVRGQVSHVPTTPEITKLKAVLCYEGYLTPVNPADGQHSLGASHQRNDITTAYSEEEQIANKERLRTSLPDVNWSDEVDVSGKEAHTGIRCTVRDHLPVVGNVPDFAQLTVQYAKLERMKHRPDSVSSAADVPQLFIIGALGSRGLCTAPLAAELLAAQIFDEALPLDDETLAELHPNRFHIRKLLKGAL
ncbi:bifunctional tRNA (5-methylaminomethyl-2-thiouridine)(34)-methyltransferase MnmD/FAD-dependent 5-carboxymethylaminomethyl-2-thiouridine(34) oxidoreductase MnmC [Morganella psychrotolerans]|uniref:tRNA 5-methylaminomethyl-2-thiouridine biosynthesis bifunctional protein MnmC n=1 Tax=Morganella psychrotolerans TaxID=368603 RepID=A0A5M9RBG1_9GAMM|nr:bifunctional tRNA (5-methylaminomethyl-2-thiouridine)(34)-methyltransferase MnmD/FAD-dependent 5-carboxymethylaminomethyl-2-thiouridine(34) oxidoreductase MnmC [Morganella psychrotolerans]KAA8716785.1 bifunctional tRNA (5-methylaminomethyl-2-thiouridine)(34)-methyltransferase MnmD/FAD-dependent 5-carboxymethylaminomethyl-2-thiouridine(34) oxidoreductase MnmC [Morganella psychrotolerans]